MKNGHWMHKESAIDISKMERKKTFNTHKFIYTHMWGKTNEGKQNTQQREITKQLREIKNHFNLYKFKCAFHLLKSPNDILNIFILLHVIVWLITNIWNSPMSISKWYRRKSVSNINVFVHCATVLATAMQCNAMTNI